MLEKIDFAFQPIIDINSGSFYAVEALLRGYKESGFSSIDSFFDYFYHQKELYTIDLKLREKALKKFIQIPGFRKYKLFYNLDNRLFLMKDFDPGNTAALLNSFNLRKEHICFEISEKHKLTENSGLEILLEHYHKEQFQVAIDDFGQGFAGYKLLYDVQPDFIKIDRFFLANIKKDHKKQILVRNIVQIAAQLGIRTIAEGIETKEEFLICKEIGCQYVQGYFIQRPITDIANIAPSYKHIEEIVIRDRRKEKRPIENYLEQIAAFTDKERIQDIVEFMKENNEKRVAILNTLQEPIGIIDEEKLSPYLYSPYGFSLLRNEKSKVFYTKYFLKKVPTIDIHASSEDILALYASMPMNNGLLVTKASKYVGYLSSEAILKLIHKERLLLAQDQNPLSHLPGNRLIDNHIRSLLNEKKEFTICYFDFNNFKAYNDHYGFRQGDRVIVLFAQILRKRLKKSFVGHIGGDDFIAIFEGEFEEFFHKINRVSQEFAEDVRFFYSQEDRQRGYINGYDREGQRKRFGFLSISSALLYIPSTSKECSLNSINAILVPLKKMAKQSSLLWSAACML